MHIKSRHKFKTQWDWLYYLQNDLGCNNLSIQISKKLENGDIIFTKRYNFLELQHYDPFQKLPMNTNETYFKKRTQIIDEASHRTILDIELVIDIDEPMKPFKTIKQTAIWVCKKLKKLKSDYKCYWTGSKSYHIHIFDEKFRGKEDIKPYLIKFLGGDMMKAHTSQLIALEGAPHYKSGISKQEVELI